MRLISGKTTPARKQPKRETPTKTHSGMLITEYEYGPRALPDLYLIVQVSLRALPNIPSSSTRIHPRSPASQVAL